MTAGTGGGERRFAPDPNWCRPIGVDDRGQVVGYLELVPETGFGGFLWDDGEIVGRSPAGVPEQIHAVLWR